MSKNSQKPSKKSFRNSKPLKNKEFKDLSISNNKCPSSRGNGGRPQSGPSLSLKSISAKKNKKRGKGTKCRLKNNKIKKK